MDEGEVEMKTIDLRLYLFHVPPPSPFALMLPLTLVFDSTICSHTRTWKIFGQMREVAMSSTASTTGPGGGEADYNRSGISSLDLVMDDDDLDEDEIDVTF